MKGDLRQWSESFSGIKAWKEWETSFPFYVHEAIENTLRYLREKTDDREDAPIDIGGAIHEEEKRRVFVNFFHRSRFHATVEVSWREDSILLSMRIEERIHERFSEYDHEYFENLADGIELLAGMYRDIAKIIYASKTIVDARNYDPDKEPLESRPVNHPPADIRSFDDLKDLYEHAETRPARSIQLWIDRIPPERACEVVKVISHVLNVKYGRGFTAIKEVGTGFKYVGYRWHDVLASANGVLLAVEIVYDPEIGVVSIDLSEEVEEWFNFDPLNTKSVKVYTNYLREVAEALRDYPVIFEELTTTLKQLERHVDEKEVKS